MAVCWWGRGEYAASKCLRGRSVCAHCVLTPGCAAYGPPQSGIADTSLDSAAAHARLVKLVAAALADAGAPASSTMAWAGNGALRHAWDEGSDDDDDDDPYHGDDHSSTARPTATGTDSATADGVRGAHAALMVALDRFTAALAAVQSGGSYNAAIARGAGLAASLVSVVGTPQRLRPADPSSG